MTQYQQAQLLHKHLTGDFVFFNKKGNKVPRQAFVLMLNTLVKNGYIDQTTAQVTDKGRKYCDQQHSNIDLTVLS